MKRSKAIELLENELLGLLQAYKKDKASVHDITNCMLNSIEYGIKMCPPKYIKEVEYDYENFDGISRSTWTKEKKLIKVNEWESEDEEK